MSGLDHDGIGQAQGCFDADRQVIRQCADGCNHQGRFYPLVRDVLRRPHHDFALDQLEFLVLVDDAGFDHAADVIDGECPARETFGSCCDGDVHVRLRFRDRRNIAYVGRFGRWRRRYAAGAAIRLRP